MPRTAGAASDAGHESRAARWTGLLVLTSTDGSVQALEVSAPPGPVPPAEFSDRDSGDLSLWLALLFAFLGGLILNVMPCVLPILAMKALSLGTPWRAKAAAKASPMPRARC